MRCERRKGLFFTLTPHSLPFTSNLMNVEQYREYCIIKAGVTEGFPFDEDTLVFRVEGKIFVLLSLSEGSVNLKCDPEKAIRLREQYPTVVQPGYHMNKAHWNTVHLDLVSDPLIKEWTDHSYDMVVAKLPKKLKEKLPNYI